MNSPALLPEPTEEAQTVSQAVDRFLLGDNETVRISLADLQMLVGAETDLYTFAETLRQQLVQKKRTLTKFLEQARSPENGPFTDGMCRFYKIDADIVESLCEIFENL